MCGRTRCSLRAEDFPRACHRNHGPSRTVDIHLYRPSYNVSPGSNIPVVRRDDGCDSDAYAVHCMKWGLVPSFTKKDEKPDFFKMFNARSESVGEKASFRRLLPKSRCLVAVEGFYEWKKNGSRKQPYYIHFRNGHPLVFAALYDSWQNSEGEKLYTFTILTTSSSSTLQWLHDRMPVILGDKGSTDTWLSGSASNVNSLLKPYEGSDLVWYPVTASMGKTSFNGPECIKEVQLETGANRPISNFFAPKGVKREDLKPELTVTYESKTAVPQCQEEYKTKGDDSKSNEFSSLQDGVINCFIVNDGSEPERLEKKSETEKEHDGLQVTFSNASKKSAALNSFERKGVKREDSNSEQLLTNESINTDLSESIKEDLSESIKEESETENLNQVSQSRASIPFHKDASLPHKKRGYGEISADLLPAIGKADQLSNSPREKKSNLKTAGDKQQTLFSYFGKS